MPRLLFRFAKRLKARIEEQSIKRTKKKQKDLILNKTLKRLGVDKEKLMKDIEEVKKNGNKLNMQLNKK